MGVAVLESGSVRRKWWHHQPRAPKRPLFGSVYIVYGYKNDKNVLVIRQKEKETRYAKLKLFVLPVYTLAQKQNISCR